MGGRAALVGSEDEGGGSESEAENILLQSSDDEEVRGLVGGRPAVTGGNRSMEAGTAAAHAGAPDDVITLA